MMNGSKRLILLTAFLLAIGLTSACGGGNTNAPGDTGTAPTAPAEGGDSIAVDSATAEAVYRQNCVACHAADLQGGGGPNLQKVGAAKSADDIKAIISDGEGRMPAFKGRLSNEEIDALSAWLAAKK